MNVYLAWALTILYFIVYPIWFVVWYIVIAAVALAKLLYRPIAWLLQPVVYLGRFLLACFVAPFHFIAKFETIYIYLGVAALVGIIGGLILTYIYGSLHSALQLDARPEPKGRTAKQYRESRQKEKIKIETPLMSPGYLSMSDGKSRRGRNLLSQTIMEEMDSDY